MKLDERLRERMSTLARESDTPLDPATIERIARTVASDGPALVRAAHRRQKAARVTYGALALAACALLAFAVRRPHGAGAPVVARANPAPVPAPGSAPVRELPRVAAAPADPRPCAARALTAAPLFATGPRGGRRADLGALALVVAARGTTVHFAASTPCQTVLALTAGRIVVHARDLAGGELRVQTPAGDVVVHGTVFAVESRHARTTVTVARGAVGLERNARALATLTRGEQAQLVASAMDDARDTAAALLSRRVLPAAAVRALLVSVGLDPRSDGEAPLPAAPAAERAHAPATPSPASAGTPDEWVHEADVRRTAGDLDSARQLYTRAGRADGTTAEAAWLALGRMEFSVGRLAAASAALEERARRFPDGALGAESTWLALRVAQRGGDVRAARAAAAELLRRWPRSPYATRAQQAFTADGGAP